MESISMIISLWLAPKLKLDPMHSMILTQAVTSIIKSQTIHNMIASLMEYDFINTTNIMFLVIVGSIYVLWRYKGKINYINESPYVIYEIYDKDTLKLFEKYIGYYLSNTIQDMKVGCDKKTSYKLKYNYVKPMNFSFDYNGVIIKGNIQTSYNEIKSQEERSNNSMVEVIINKPCLKITLVENLISFENLIKYFEEQIQIAENNKSKIELYGVNVGLSSIDNPNKNILKNYYSNILIISKTLYNPDSYWNEYFNNKKNILMRMSKLDSCNILLYGPPGSGKSKLIEIIAKTTKRHIISLNLKILGKYQFINLLNEPYIHSFRKEPKEVIYVFEEFDIAIDYLAAKDNLYNNKLAENNKQNNMKYSKFTKDINDLVVNDDIIKLMDNRSSELTINDLLEIFQSAIPRHGQMIFATTNNFDKIKKKVPPALFRPGRLTPIMIDYIDQESFDELVMHYFNVSNTIELFRGHTVSTSLIIETVHISEYNYDEFTKLMIDILNKNRNIVYSDGC